MENKQLLQENTQFGSYIVTGKLSRHHDGEREVYLAVDGEDRKVVLTVFDIQSPRYAAEDKEQEFQAVSIDEIRFYKECTEAVGDNDIIGMPKFLGCGIDSCEGRRYGWMVQEYVCGDSLDQEILRQGTIPVKDALTIIRKVLYIVEAVARFTNGGGHYNISSDNIIVRYEAGEVADVRLIGFTHIGESHSGTSTIEEDDLDKRFRAPETGKGIHSYRSDIFSLGMVLLLMLTGYPKVVETDQFTVALDGGAPDLADISSSDFQKSLWKKAGKTLTSTLCLVLRKATDASPASRFASAIKFKEFLSKAEKNLHKASTQTQTQENAQPAYGYNGGSISTEKFGISGKIVSPANESGNRKALDDVAGMADLKALFRRDFIRIVRNPKIAQAYGIKPSNCTLLYGPQGCGKTFIAEKAAQESGLKYKVVNPSELGSIYIHGAQQKIAELFDEAEKKAPIILIFDEFDALVPKRDNDHTGNQANEVNEMLTQLNNCASRGIYVLATTNRPTLLDPAIMRKGRVDRTVYVSLPDQEARAELFRLEIERRPNLDIDYNALASATEHYTCSDISFIVEESARLCFEETLDRSLDEPLPLSMPRLMDVIKKTSSSISEAQHKEYLAVKKQMEERPDSNARKKLGFTI